MPEMVRKQVYIDARQGQLLLARMGRRAPMKDKRRWAREDLYDR